MQFVLATNRKAKCLLSTDEKTLPSPPSNTVYQLFFHTVLIVLKYSKVSIFHILWHVGLVHCSCCVILSMMSRC